MSRHGSHLLLPVSGARPMDVDQGVPSVTAGTHLKTGEAPSVYRPWTGTITWVRERMYGANWYQPRMARNSVVVIASGLSSS
jgi:hypothetical protein